MNLTRDILESMASLPPYPVVLQRAIELLNTSDSSIQDVVDSIQYDQSITAKVLKVCNSAYFGFRREVNCLKEALVLIGFKQLIEIIISQEALKFFPNSNSQYTELWRHSVGCALLSGLTARRLKEETTPIFFTASLLHDIGKVALTNSVDDYLGDTKKYIQERQIPFTEAEKKVWGIDHADLGGRIMETWNFPKPIVAAVRYHHSPFLVRDNYEIVRRTYLCDIISVMMDIGGGVERLPFQVYLEILRQFNLEEEDHDWFVIQLKDRFQFLRQVLNVTGHEENAGDILDYFAIGTHKN